MASGVSVFVPLQKLALDLCHRPYKHKSTSASNYKVRSQEMSLLSLLLTVVEVRPKIELLDDRGVQRVSACELTV